MSDAGLEARFKKPPSLYPVDAENRAGHGAEYPGSEWRSPIRESAMNECQRHSIARIHGALRRKSGYCLASGSREEQERSTSSVLSQASDESIDSGRPADPTPAPVCGELRR